MYENQGVLKHQLLVYPITATVIKMASLVRLLARMIRSVLFGKHLTNITMVAMSLFSLNIFFSCLQGPVRKNEL